MLRSLQLMRFIQINLVLIRYGLNPSVVDSFFPWLNRFNPWRFKKKQKMRGESMRLILEELGPIFVKFGQALSTRCDLLPDDIALELAKLQDQVPPFSSSVAVKIIEKAYGKSLEACFLTFDQEPLASASIAQVHAAQLFNGEDVVVKVLRPTILKVIKHDIALMYLGARMVERFWKQGRRLKPVQIVREFEHTICDELDLVHEAANASQLRRNFQRSKEMYVPRVYWAYAQKNIMVVERIYGIRISDIVALKAHHVNMKKLAERGVKIFFTQVLRDNFFHADMHPGNLFIDITHPDDPKYIGVDFGIMGSLSNEDQRYLAENLLAFFKRDYRRVALLHVESGWIPSGSRVDQFESAIRTVCEPIFEKPLKDISFGQLLLRLFQTADRFHMEVQPQLFLLQKTLLSVEGLGRQLYPDLDLWRTAKPLLERWVKEQKGMRQALFSSLKHLPETMSQTFQIPAVLYDVLYQTRVVQHRLSQQRQSNDRVPTENGSRQKRGFILGAGLALLISALVSMLLVHAPASPWSWIGLGVGMVLLLSMLFFSSSRKETFRGENR